jgi:hypothetical protein
VQLALPVRRDAAGWSWHRLVERVVMRRCEDGTLEELFLHVIPEPILAGFEALGDRMALSGGMSAGMLRRRRVATADVPAFGAAPEMEPPAIGGEAFHAPCAARRRVEIDVVHIRHRPIVRDGATVRPPWDLRAGRWDNRLDPRRNGQP